MLEADKALLDGMPWRKPRLPRRYGGPLVRCGNR